MADRHEIDPTCPSHTPGTPKGEERVRRHGREPGRDERQARARRPATRRASTPRREEPIDPRMPHLPPA